MRLTNAHREDVRVKVVTSVFKPRHEAHTKEAHSITAAIRQVVLTAKQREHIDALPKDFFYTNYRYMAVQCGDEQASHARIPLDPATAFPATIANGRVVIVPAAKTALIARIKAWTEVERSFYAEKSAFERTTRGILGAITTSEKLLEVMPDVGKLMGEEYFTPATTPNLPAEVVSSINQQVAAAMKVAA